MEGNEGLVLGELVPGLNLEERLRRKWALLERTPQNLWR
jgi:hypothetical protein